MSRAGSVLHVLPHDEARGAQIHARLLRDLLDGQECRHDLVLIFEQGRSVTGAEHALGVRSRLGRRLGFSPVAAWRLWQLIRNNRPDIVVAHGSEPLKYLFYLPTARTRLIYHRIGRSMPARSPLSGRMTGVLARRADRMIGVGSAVTELAIRELGVPREKTRTISNGRDPAEFYPAVAPPRATPRLLFVGHMSPSKRPEWFARLTTRLAGEFEAVAIGDGPLLAQLRRCYGGVQFLGRSGAVADAMRSSDIFVFPSRSAGEGLPGVLVEAAMCGLPIVATRVPGADEVIVDGLTGALVEEDDFDSLVAAVQSLLDDAELRRTLGEAASRHARDLFALDECARRWRDEILDVLKMTDATGSRGAGHSDRHGSTHS